MKTADGCKLFGAHQALTGVSDGVVLLHSVIGCNYGSLTFHATHDMSDIRQTCTVLSDQNAIFGGDESVEKAITHVLELYNPSVIFVVTGCVSDIIRDDVEAVIRGIDCDIPIIAVEAAGYRGRVKDGYDAGSAALIKLMEHSESIVKNGINIIGLGADDFRIEQDIEAIKELLGKKAQIISVLSNCSFSELSYAPSAALNIVIGRGAALAKKMKEEFNIPWVNIDYPYGVTGASELWKVLEDYLGLDYSRERKLFSAYTAEGLKNIYSYLQGLYGLNASIIGNGARMRGMSRFLERELGIEAAIKEDREALTDMENFYDKIRKNRTDLIFGSSFEKEIADELNMPLIRYDYPVFDRVCVTKRPFIGAEGTIIMVEEIVNEIIANNRLKGALYQ